MRYPIRELELSHLQPDWSLDLVFEKNDSGLALIVRYCDRPIGFILQPFPTQTPLSAATVAQLLDQQIGTQLLQEKIRQDLPQTAAPVPFPTLTVAICTKDRPDNMQRCLTALLALQQPDLEQPPPFDILVVDNAPSDERTYELIQSMPSVQYTREPKPGLDFARNRALQEATGELLAFLDDDVIVDRRWLVGLQEAWAENPDAGGFTGLVLPYELETEAQIIFERRGGFRRGFEKIRYHGSTQVDNPFYPCGAGNFGAGCNMAFRRDVLLKMGGFDDALDTGAPLPGGGDLDIFYRIVRAGYPLIYEPQFLVYHQHRREFKQLQRQYWSWGAGFMAFIVKSYQHDQSQRQRIKLLRIIGWWFKYQFKQLLDGYVGSRILPPRMVWAELWGGIQGLCGEYQRSQRRVEQIRRQYS